MRLTYKSLSLACVLTLGLPAAVGCTDDGSGGTSADGDSSGDGDGDGSETGDGDGTETGDGSETGDGDGDGDTGSTAPGDGDGDGDGDPGSPALPEDFPASLTNAGGCGDVYIAVTNDEGTVGLLFNGSELAATAHEMGETQIRESVLPSPDVNLRAAIGTLLDDGCNDTGDGPQIEHEWTAVSGTVTLTVVPQGMAEPWAMPADATLELTNVTFEGEGLEPVVVDSWTVEDVYVGWLPG
ncbi:hypothetical protein ENSA5_30760 [Enhygromyxa salina]|uniref:Endo-1,4-beta-xylanase A n=1 Tax=Enhygromyxa salina TaxID=215803 RepID=A0A2S9XZA8_9BACT|nr:hypothetical protein [Enhygromyxa salina]PRP98091.1 hypothetical protein ENSA5_30760 [Enhygromyxa salina]